MRITLNVDNATMQFNLIPENEEEKKLLSILEDYSGEALVRGDKDGGMYSTNFKKLIVTIVPKKTN